MKGRTVVLLLVLGGVVAVLLWKGPTALEFFVMRVLGDEEAKRRAKLLADVGDRLDSLRDELAQEHGIETWIGSTLRSTSDQADRVKEGVSATQNSWHLLGRAVDLYPLLDGKPDLDGRTWDTSFRKMHEVAALYGFTGLAFNSDGSRRYINTSKGRIWDGGHLEYRDGMTFAEAKLKTGGAIG